MKILIDFTEFNGPNYSLEVYGLRLLSAISVDCSDQITLLVPKSGESRIRKLFPNFDYLIFNKLPNPQFTRPMSVILFPLRQHRYKSLVNKFDVLFIMTHSNPITSCKTKCRKVIVIHDLTYTHNPIKPLEFLRTRSWGKYFLHRQLLNSNIVICISQFTKDHIRSEFPDVSQDKIHVIYNSVKLPLSEKSPFNNSNYGKYILFVNTLKPYKNVQTLIKAFNKLKREIDLNLVIVGKETSFWKDDICTYINNNNLSNRIIRLENMSDEELKWLYSHASLFVTTSLHEGFGYTPIEAAICKCPVISSNCESLPEVTMGMVNYYSPATDEYALANCIKKTIEIPSDPKYLEFISSTFINRYSVQKQWSDIYKLFN